MNAAFVILVGFGLGAGLLGYALVRARKRRLDTFESEPEALPIKESPLPAEPAEPVAEAVSTLEVDEVEVKVEQSAEKPEADPKIHDGLARSRGFLLGRLSEIFTSGASLKDEMVDELEEALLSADVGVRMAMEFCDRVREDIKQKRVKDSGDIQQALRAYLSTCFNGAAKNGFPHTSEKPHVVLFVGVNGAGKTTTIGKIASQLAAENKNIVLAAGDTFRAAAAEQLEIWSQRTNAKLIRGEAGVDPASVIFNALSHAKESGVDYVLADTAGRLHTKSELMDELQKIRRVAGKACEGAPHDVWLVVDATMGQNALQQAKEFHDALGLTGVVLTKLDGTARGGIVVSIAHTLKLPILFVGVGEQADDLRPFVPENFVESLFAAQN
ncbi:MAG: signal recognition particle-docking protein FtsY [Myxococcota bacterium]|nr:signal recognition particle-docking protein FtsY [Myxococcota bacterium]